MIGDKVMACHVIERTSPKGPGQVFLGTCILCGKTNLTITDANKPCENKDKVSYKEALVRVL